MTPGRSGVHGIEVVTEHLDSAALRALDMTFTRDRSALRCTVVARSIGYKGGNLGAWTARPT